MNNASLRLLVVISMAALVNGITIQHISYHLPCRLVLAHNSCGDAQDIFLHASPKCMTTNTQIASVVFS